MTIVVLSDTSIHLYYFLTNFVKEKGKEKGGFLCIIRRFKVLQCLVTLLTKKSSNTSRKALVHIEGPDVTEEEPSKSGFPLYLVFFCN